MPERSWVSHDLDPDWSALPDRPGCEELAPGFLLFAGVSNSYAMDTTAGLVIVDPGHAMTAERFHRAVREWSDTPLHTVIYTHGHPDHAAGLGPFLDAGERPAIVAQENTVARFERYRLTHGFNQHINRRQSGNRDLRFPDSFVAPTVTYRDALRLRVGDLDVHLRAVRGETDDSSTVWIPQWKALFVGDLATWKVPNAGNPQKVQRYPTDWAAGLEEAAASGAEWLCPGHDPVLRGEQNVRTMLSDHARYLGSLIEQVLERMNRGDTYDEILHDVAPDPALAGKPYLRQVWNHSSFIVRDLLRLWGGWWTGRAADLLPATLHAQAAEIARLGGGVEAIVARGRELLEGGDVVMASHLAEWAAEAAPDDRPAQELKRDVYRARAEGETAGIACGAFRAAMNDAERAIVAMDT